MADFTFLDVNPTMESLNQFTELKTLNYQSFSPFSSDNLFNNINQAPEAEIPSNWDNNLTAAAGFIHYSSHGNPVLVSQSIFTAENEVFHENQKRKAWDFVSESSYGSPYSFPYVSESGIKIRNNTGRGKKAKSNDKEQEKPREVVHVRARRGQATNSHCLAERVRRGKINEKLRSLQDIVPGCYKNMGMAVMLDEIINYVQLLQNQIEFLSMKLTAASSCYDFNSDSDNMETVQEAKDLMKEGFVEVPKLALSIQHMMRL